MARPFRSELQPLIARRAAAQPAAVAERDGDFRGRAAAARPPPAPDLELEHVEDGHGANPAQRRLPHAGASRRAGRPQHHHAVYSLQGGHRSGPRQVHAGRHQAMARQGPVGQGARAAAQNPPGLPFWQGRAHDQHPLPQHIQHEDVDLRPGAERHRARARARHIPSLCGHAAQRRGPALRGLPAPGDVADRPGGPPLRGRQPPRRRAHTRARGRRGRAVRKP
mmetsp:Transcript_60355/g.186862  ORF Transcript_60355/g.186862 Transcript_60355/m.186862 type:complete len:223 (-) Transcript_60355:1489-2157(-)